jgi:hypothetical protein
VNVTGVCTTGVPTGIPYNAYENFVAIVSNEPGACHYELVFANGFTYGGDLQFVNYQDGPCTYVEPTVTAPIPIDNPPSTCVADAGRD